MSRILGVLWMMVCLLMTGVGTVQAATVGLGGNGITIDAGTMGKFTLEYPSLMMADGKAAPKIIQRNIAGKNAVVKYDNGGQANISVQDDGKVTLKFSGLGADVRSLKMAMSIGIEYIQGGKWKIGDAEAKPFPANKTPGGHFFQANNAGALTLTNYEGKSLSITPPPYSYGQMTDTREWNWAQFVWAFFAPYNKDNPQITIAIADGAPTAATDKPGALIDQFGQLSTADWPGKVKSVEELKADVESEKAYYASLQPPAFDKYGGLPGSREKLGLKQTGFFHVVQKDGKWLMVNPEGNLFFHLGICVFNPGDDYTLVKGREQTFAAIPPYDGDMKSAFRAEN